MVRLGVNIDHVATLRQARGTRYPDPIAAAALAEGAGADQIVIHLREDRRHIQEQDLWTLRKTVRTGLNVELACTDEIVGIACEARPDRCTFVPERRKELTTEGGLDLRRAGRALPKALARLCERSIGVSLFIDPDPAQVAAAHALGATAVEFHTGAYAEATNEGALTHELDRLRRAGELAAAKGMEVAAGHGLNYENIRRVVKIGKMIVEFNIGHSIVARAVFVGLEQAVREMKQLLVSQ
ncbi:MAG: pyridoxine 5'-phosphate synthase [Deltaproteobacteria bacterium]|nr:pyridoxine 5'-phosphate synthase [Deltaproteobacteria bacterium]